MRGLHTYRMLGHLTRRNKGKAYLSAIYAVLRHVGGRIALHNWNEQNTNTSFAALRLTRCTGKRPHYCRERKQGVTEEHYLLSPASPGIYLNVSSPPFYNYIRSSRVGLHFSFAIPTVVMMFARRRSCCRRYSLPPRNEKSSSPSFFWYTAVLSDHFMGATSVLPAENQRVLR